MTGAGRRHTRARGAASGIVDLLRNVTDDERLGAHPYVRVLDGRLRLLGVAESSHSNAVALVREAALRAVDQLRTNRDNGERLYAIVARCDLGGEMHKIVAADLGISRRTFYRDLAFAREAIDERVHDGMLRETAPAAARPNVTDARLQTARSLAAGGHWRAAVGHFAPVVEKLHGEEAVWGHCVLAELLLDGGEVRAARRELRRARAAADDADGHGAAHAGLTNAKLLYQTGRAPEAARSLEQLLGQLETFTDAGSPLALDTFSETLTLLAFCYHERGDFAAAAATNARNPASDERVPVSPSARRQFLNVDAMLACDGSAGPSAAQRACRTFYDFAVARGFLDDISSALLQMGGLARLERRFDEAERLAREALAIQHAIGADGTPVLNMLTGIAVDRGDYDGAVRIARRMRTQATAGSHAWSGAHLHEAEALALAGRQREARAICQRVARDADTRDVRVAAWLRRVEAMVFDGLGDETQAFRAAGSALEILGKDAPPFHQIKNLLIAQHIRPSRAQRAQIRRLADVLGWKPSARRP